MPTDATREKTAAAAAAVAEVRNGMTLGLGTGSTAAIFVRLVGEELAAGRLDDIRAVCTSEETASLAGEMGIPVLEPADAGLISLAVDGADEIDPQLRLIKGRGGALLREKVVEQAARHFIVIADESKLVNRLGGVPLPVEVVRFCSRLFERRWREEGLAVELRTRGGSPFETDEGHHILDVTVPPAVAVGELHDALKKRAGVVETGYFPTEASAAFIASPQGVRTLSRRGWSGASS